MSSTMTTDQITRIADQFMAETDTGSVNEAERGAAIHAMKANPKIVIHVANSIGERNLAGTKNDYEYAVSLLADLLSR